MRNPADVRSAPAERRNRRVQWATLSLMAALLCCCGGRSDAGWTPSKEAISRKDGATAQPDLFHRRDRGSALVDNALMSDAFLFCPAPYYAEEMQGSYMGSWEGYLKCADMMYPIHGQLYLELQVGHPFLTVTGKFEGSPMARGQTIQGSVYGTVTCEKLEAGIDAMGGGGRSYTGNLTGTYMPTSGIAPGFRVESWTVMEMDGYCEGQGTWTATR